MTQAEQGRELVTERQLVVSVFGEDQERTLAFPCVTLDLDQTSLLERGWAIDGSQVLVPVIRSVVRDYTGLDHLESWPEALARTEGEVAKFLAGFGWGAKFE
jgi:hypothetical protein